MAQKSAIEKSQLLTAQMIWGALTVSLGILVFVAQNLEQPLNDNSDLTTKLNSIFPIIAAVTFGVSIAIRNLKIAPKQQAHSQNGPTQSPIARYLPRMLIRCALHESVAILGFVLATLSNSPAALYPYAVAAILANLFVFPSVERVSAQ